MRWLIPLLLVCVLQASTAWAQDEAAVMTGLRAALASCVAQLPGPLRAAMHEPRVRRTTRVPPRTRAAWRACLARERDVADHTAMSALRDDLLVLVPEAQRTPSMRAEAGAIATHLVRETRTTAEHYDMVGSPLFNNFLVHIGARSAGFCYHWTATLARALNALSWRHFARVWGVANIRKATENNALVLTARGAPLASGIVYDPWRGAGTPYWRGVADDHYRWTLRYTERNLAMGVGLDVAPPASVHR